MKRKIVILIILIMAILSPLSAQNRPRLAILPFTGGVGNDGETIAMLIGNQAELRNAFTTVPRTGNVEAVMREQRFQRSGLTDSDTIAQLGRQMNAEYVVSGHIQQLGTRRLVLISIVHVESLQQIAGDYKEYTDISEIRAYLPDMVRKIVAASRQDTSRLSRLAIAPFHIMSGGVNERDAEVLAHIMAVEIANSGRYAVLPRTSTIESAMREHSIQRSGITDPASIRRIGQATNAAFVLAGTITSLGSMNLFLAQIINVETGEQVEGGDEEYRNITDGLNKMQVLSRTLTGISSIPQGFVRIPGGTFTMGSPASEQGRLSDETQRRVTISAFYMSRYEVTQREYQEIMGTNPSRFTGDLDRPVEWVSWFDAVEYCNRRSQREGLTPAYTISGSGDNRAVTWNRSANGYRLPTEAEWEYACRAGTTTAYNTGASISDNTGWYDANSAGSTQRVGQKQANAWGLYDMHGNVWEWCWDWYGAYPAGAQTDPVGASTGSIRVLRGGSWVSSAGSTRSSYRHFNGPYLRHSSIGFRVVRP